MADVPFSIGRYTVFSELASGGQAAVHLGRFTAPAGFSRAVAIKRVRPELANDERAKAMLLDEARLASRVQHPNVVQTLDVVWHEGELVLVMELIQGESLVRLLRATKGKLPAPVVVSIVSQALRGLHAAHRATDAEGRPLGLIHRDLSPQNIIVDVHGVAKVLDFGVAKARGRSQEDTDVGTLKGKLSYMAPEQIHGLSDQRSDLWAMGVVLWECLTGEKLFTAESDGAVVGKLLSMPIPSLASRGIDARLDAVVRRALERELASRFTTAEEMADELERCGPAATTQVAKWVLETANEAIERTKQRVRELESETVNAPVSPAPSPVPASRRSVVAVAVAAVSALVLAGVVGRWVKGSSDGRTAEGAGAQVRAIGSGESSASRGTADLARPNDSVGANPTRPTDADTAELLRPADPTRAPDSPAELMRPADPTRAPDSAAELIRPADPTRAPDSAAELIRSADPTRAPDSTANPLRPSEPTRTPGSATDPTRPADSTRTADSTANPLRPSEPTRTPGSATDPTRAADSTLTASPLVGRPKPRPRPKPAKKPGCEPPYTVLNGVKQWKPECF